MSTDIIDTDIKTSFAKGKNLIMYANDHPYKVTAVDSASITANDHPFKVLIEGGVVTPEQFAELEAKVAALATDLTFKGSVDTFADLPATADDGDTYLVTSTGILYTFVNNDPIPLNEGVNVVQTTGTSTTDVMSQNAVTGMIYPQYANQDKFNIAFGANADTSAVSGTNGAIAIGRYAKVSGSQGINIANSNSTNGGAGAGSIVIGGSTMNSTAVGTIAIGTGTHLMPQSGAIKIGGSTTASATNAVAIGMQASATQNFATAIGNSAKAQGEASLAVGGPSSGIAAQATAENSIALGSGAVASRQGEMNIGASYNGYNNSAYRLLTGLYDGQSAHDAATVGQLGETLTDTEFINILNGEES